jgi:simple sugar transport system substrate-binding protein
MKISKWCLAVLGIAILTLSGILLFQSNVRPQKHFTGVRIIFFNGGAAGDSFATVVNNGARAAQEDLGPTVEYMWSDWDTNKMALQFKEAIDRSPDAICMMGHPGSNVLGPLIEEAIRKGIIVTLQNVDLPDIRKQYIDKGFGYVGQELYSSGKMLSSGVVRKFGLHTGDKALVVGPGIGMDGEALNARGMRTKGCMDGLKKAGLTVYSIPITPELESDPKNLGVSFIAHAMLKYPTIKVLVTDTGTMTSSMEFILKQLGKKPGEIIVAGFDLSIGTVKGIKDGYVNLVHDQQPYLQGYLPILQACLVKKYGFAGLYIDTGVGLIDASNVDAVAELAKEQIR